MQQKASLDNQLVFGLTLNSPQKQPAEGTAAGAATVAAPSGNVVQKNHLFKAILDSKSTKAGNGESALIKPLTTAPATATATTAMQSEKMEVDDQQSNVKRKLNQV